MKSIKSAVICGLFLVTCVVVSIDAKITFGSQNSAFNISSGARFNVGSQNLIINGTLQRSTDSQISGNSITFDQGVLLSSGLEAFMQGQYDPTGADSIRLQGNGRFRAEPGTLLQSLSVAGAGNRLEGQPQFSEDIILADGGTSLSLALQSRLNKNIQLHGGTVTLEDDLGLIDDVIISGSGTIELNNRSLKLGSIYTSSWPGTLFFNNATDLVLNGSLDLAGTWTFGGVSCISGNGGVLDLSRGGQIIVDNNAILQIYDLSILGLGDAKGKIIMRNDAAQIRTANSSFRIDQHFTTSHGTLSAFGPTTVMLGNQNWNFVSGGKLAVDGTTLWVDPLDTPCDSGTINAPYPIFVGSNWSANVAANEVAGNFSLTNRGTVKSVVDAGTAKISPATCFLLSGGVSGEVNLDECLCLGPNDVINVVGDACINGNGVEVSFTDQPRPQFIVRPGVSVTLVNITLTDINQITFDLRDNAAIKIGQNVIWELDRDITFSANATIEVLNHATSCSDISNDGCNVFTIRGEHCRRTFAISPVVNQLLNGGPYQPFRLGHNTLMLENAEVSGLDHIFYFNDDVCSSAIALSCNSAVDINSSFPDVLGNLGTNINFFVEGSNNDLILRHDGYVLGGNISFGDHPDNELNIRFNLADPLVSSTPGRSGVLDNFPFVVLSGNPGIFLYSNVGLAHLTFADFNACIRCTNSNAFVADNNSLLSYERLSVLDNPIKQQSARFRFEGVEMLGLRVDPSFIRMPRVGYNLLRPTALHIERQRQEEQCMRVARKRVRIDNHHKNEKKSEKGAKKSAQKFPIRAPESVLSLDYNHKGEKIVSNMDQYRVIRALTNIPTTFDQQIVNQTHNATSPLVGNILLQNTQFNGFDVGLSPFNLVLDNDAQISQAFVGDVPTPIVFEADQKIFVRGRRTQFNIRGSVTISQDNLFFGDNAELTINFIKQGTAQPVLHISPGTTLDLERDVIVRIQGEGTVIFGDGTNVVMHGLKSINCVTGLQTVSNRPQLLIQNKAVVTLDNDAFSRIRGVGHVEILSDAVMRINSIGTLVVGDDVPVHKEPGADARNDIEFYVVHNGRVELGQDELAARSAFLSFRYVTTNIHFNAGGVLFIAPGGVFEGNSASGAPVHGRIQELSFNSGGLFVNGSGILSLGSNLFDNTTAAALGVAYDGRLASITGGGTIQFINDSQSGFDSAAVSGALNPSDNAFSFFSSRSLRDVVLALINLG